MRRGEYLEALERTGGRILLLSGGGNDLVAGGELARHLRAFEPSLTPAQYLRPSFNGVLDAAIACIEKIVRASGRAFPQCRVICHGYDYTIPNDGKWLGKPMASRGITDAGLQKAIAARDGRPAEHADASTSRTRRRASPSSIAAAWSATAAGMTSCTRPTRATERVARKFEAEIARLTGRPARLRRRAAPPRRPTPCAPAAAPGRRPGPRPRSPRATRCTSASTRSIPAHYEGWKGELTACEFDAERHGHARDHGRLRGQRADDHRRDPRQGVIAAIKAAARRMKPGDIFLMTYSGHGGQVPDFSGDEALERATTSGRDALPLRRPDRRRRALRALVRVPRRQPHPGRLRLLPFRLERSSRG